MVEMTIDSIRVSMGSGQRVVILKDSPETRFLFIWITPDQALSIAQEMQGQVAQRPLTHDLLKHIIGEMGGRVVHIAITELRQQIYYARITIEFGGRRIEIDARPSDALNLAVRFKCPIFVEEAVLEEAAVYPEAFDRASSARRDPSEKQSTKTQYNLDAFRDFIQNLDVLDDFGKD